MTWDSDIKDLAASMGYQALSNCLTEGLRFGHPGVHTWPHQSLTVGARSYDVAKGGYHGPTRLYRGVHGYERALNAERPKGESAAPGDGGWRLVPSAPFPDMGWGWAGRVGKPPIGEGVRLRDYAQALGWAVEQRSVGDSMTFRHGETVGWWIAEGWQVAEAGMDLYQPYRLYGYGYSALRAMLETERSGPAPSIAAPQCLTVEQAHTLRHGLWWVAPELDYAEHRLDGTVLLAAASGDGDWVVKDRFLQVEEAAGQDPLALAGLTARRPAF